MACLRERQPCCPVCSPCPLLQRAVAHGLDKEGGFYLGLGALLHKKRQLLAGQLQDMGFKVLPADVSAGAGWCRRCSLMRKRSRLARVLAPCLQACCRRQSMA